MFFRPRPTIIRFLASWNAAWLASLSASAAQHGSLKCRADWVAGDNFFLHGRRDLAAVVQERLRVHCADVLDECTSLRCRTRHESRLRSGRLVWLDHRARRGSTRARMVTTILLAATVVAAQGGLSLGPNREGREAETVSRLAKPPRSGPSEAKEP